MKKPVFISIGTILLAAVFFLIFPLLDKLPIITPEYAKEYYVSPLTCAYREKTCATISFDFAPYKRARNQIPQYTIEEFYNKAETRIVFYNVNFARMPFDYDEITSNPLIEKLDYFQEGKNFIVEIKRKGALLPAEIIPQGPVANIILKEGNQNYPLISNQKPASNSAAYPAFRKISFEALLKDPLKKAIILFQGQPVEFSKIEISPNQYFFDFNANIEKDKEYFLTAIITDNQNRTSVSHWMFEGQILVETILGKDRFKYLGWWGQINTNGISVREKPETSSEKVGTLSSINKVKVLKEVYGETVNDNSLWYEIDGGKYPHAYVFSEFVTPIVQPEPPQEFTIPKGLREEEYWIDFDLTKKVLTLFLYDKPVFATYASPGIAKNPTETGTFRIWWKLVKKRMKGGPPLFDHVYDHPNIPSVMFYYDSYAIHGTYWHDKFGTPQSAGCTNLTQGDAAFVFGRTNPKLNGKQSVLSSTDNPGTVVYNHY